MSDLPLGICREILLRLPAVSLFRLTAVCKGWRAVIDDPCFVKAHTNYHQLSSNNSTTIIIRNSTGAPFYPLYYFDLEALISTSGPQTFDVTPLNLTPGGLSRLTSLPVAECNGLMLIVPEYRERRYRNNEYEVMNWDPEGTWEIRNPLTQERLKLPQPNIKSRVLGVGLGYYCAADDYKVVVIDHICQTHVYSLKSDSWKNIKNCPFDLSVQNNIQHGVFLNGSVHWVSGDKIIGLDVGTEDYRQLALPRYERTPKSMQLDALSGCLFLSYYSRLHFDVWLMNDYGKEDSWMKLFSLKKRHLYYTYGGLRPVAYMKSKSRVLLQDGHGFFWFDAESDSIKMINIHGLCRISAQTCVGSLFRLRDTSCGRVAVKTSLLKLNKLTFCVRDCERAYDTDARLSLSHDGCYRLDSSCEGDEVRTATSFDPDCSTLSIPLDICLEIFLRLPAKSLIRARAVCKRWRAVIDEPSFVKAYTDKQLSPHTLVIRNSTGPPFHPLYSFDFEALNFTYGLQAIVVTPLDFTDSTLSRLPALPVSACNGLMLIAPRHRNKTLEIWNPLTHERLELPRGKFTCNSREAAIGLGYDYANDDYKAVAIRHRHRRGRDVHRTHVYSLKSDSWRRIGNCPCGGPVGPGVFLCGALNWLSLAWEMSDMIIALDLVTEKYRLLRMPPLRQRRYTVCSKKFLDVLGGCLILTDFCIAYDDIDTPFDVWVMKDYGEEESWFKLFSIEREQLWLNDSLRPVAYIKDKMQVFLQDDHFRFFMFDVETNSIKRVFIHGLTGNLYAQIIHGSIFRLHDNCGVSGGRRRIMMSATSKMKVSADSELMFCVRDAKYWNDDGPHDSCHSIY